jgi:adenylate cyclase
MNEKTYTRRLSAILSADAVGYSRLMRDDDEATVRTITAFRAAMTRMIEQYRGRVVDSPGDNLLAEFTSVVDAVNCVVEIQRELAERNAEMPEKRRMLFRVGINMGDVLEEGKRIYGDGVNVAARMESLAEAGGICISGTVYDAVESKIGLEYDFLGEHEVKNIDKPIRTYRVLSYPGAAAHRVHKAKRAIVKACRKGLWGLLAVVFVGAVVAAWHFYIRPPAPVEKMVHPLPETPSIAVLPFVNMSGDPEQEYFSDGMTDDIITDLSKISGLMVISRNSTFSYKGKKIKIPEIAKELGVKYVLEGSVRRAGNEVRINAQLIDAGSNRHIWADRFDGKNENIFNLQDKITQKIVAALSVKITSPEQKVIADKGTNNPLAYDEYLKGMNHLWKFTPKDYVKAIEHFKKAIDIDQNYSQAYAELANIYFTALFGGRKFWKEMGTNFTTARLLVSFYLKFAMKKPTSRSYQVLARMEIYKRNYDIGIHHAKRAVAIAPNDADAWATLGTMMVFSGKPVEGIKYYKRAIMLDPLHTSTGGIGFAYFALGDYGNTVKYIEKSIKDYKEKYDVRSFLAAAYAFLGDDIKAKKAFKDWHT